MHEQRKEKSLVHFQKTRSTTEQQQYTHVLHKYSYYKYGHGTSIKHFMEVMNGYDFGIKTFHPIPNLITQVQNVCLSNTCLEWRCLQQLKDALRCTKMLRISFTETLSNKHLWPTSFGWRDMKGEKNNQWNRVYFFNPGLIFIFISTLLASNPFQSRPWCRCDFWSQTQGLSKSISTAKWPREVFCSSDFSKKNPQFHPYFATSSPLNSPSAIHKIPFFFHYKPSIRSKMTTTKSGFPTQTARLWSVPSAAFWPKSPGNLNGGIMVAVLKRMTLFWCTSHNSCPISPFLCFTKISWKTCVKRRFVQEAGWFQK